MIVKKYCFIYFGFYISPSGTNLIEVREATEIPNEFKDQLEVISDMDKSTLIEVLSLNEFTDKYKGYHYLDKSYKHYSKKLEGWIY